MGASGAALPSPPQPLLGREHDTERLVALLKRGTRLITLRGPGGIGKTALALHLAHVMRPAFDHVAFVDLSPLRDAREVLPVIAAALPLLTPQGDPVAAIARFAAGSRVLVVVDNFEHVLPAATELNALLDRAEHLHLVVTSRATLQLHREQDYGLEALSLPASFGQAGSSPAVQLFTQRAQAVLPGFEQTEANTADLIRLVTALEGVPLALELAAARLRAYTLPDLLARLGQPLGLLKTEFRDRPERLRSLRAAIQWSFDLLGDEDQALFECCAVFAGSFTPEALVAVWGDAGVLDRAESLIEQSLLLRAGGDATRWKMLHPVRELALERLQHNPGASAWRERHALHFLGVLEQSQRSSTPTAQDEREKYAAEVPDMRAGLSWAVENGRADLAYRYLGPLGRLWNAFGLLAREAPLVERVLALPAPADGRLRWLALFTSLLCLSAAGDTVALETRVQAYLDLCHELSDEASAGWGKLQLADLYLNSGRPDEAWRVCQDVIREYEARGGDAAADWEHRLLYTNALRDSAYSMWDLGQFGRALEAAMHARERFREAGNDLQVLYTQATVGVALLHLQRLPEAGEVLLDGLREALGREFWKAAHDALKALSLLASAAGAWETHVRLGALSESLVDDRSPTYLNRARPDLADQARRRLGNAAYLAARRAGALLTPPEALLEAQALVQSLLPVPAHPPLTPRELEVLALLAQGHPDRKIALLLNLAPGTVSKHVANMLGKLELRNRTQLARWAAEQGRAGPKGAGPP